MPFERGTEPVGPAEARFRKVHAALAEFLARSNDDESDFAGSLPHLLASLGLTDVGGEGRVVLAAAARPARRYWWLACARPVTG